MANVNVKKNFYAQKRSEYRNNYLPFDYYDFWITAKENENLRFKNKLRDYLHTPFDWDEDQGFYEYQQSYDASRFEQANQSTQTTGRPNRRDHLNKVVKSLESKSVENLSSNNLNNKKEVKSTSIQVNGNKNERKPKSSLKPKRAQSAKQVKIKSNNENKIKFSDVKKEKSSLQNSKSFTSSLSSMAVQTPMAWRLRDYKNNRPVSKIVRSASVSNFQPKRPPFANYGWATRTKDLSVKPTHNALANKVLAIQNDEDALIELALHKLKKEANSIANEYSFVESKVADQFQNQRSDSRAWNSEYEEKYPDYSRTALKKDIYFQLNPNRLTKSSLINYNPQLVRGPRSAKKKIYYYE